jgi:hypothetical protein
VFSSAWLWGLARDRGSAPRDEQRNAATALANVRDPHAVPSIRRVLCKGDPELQLLCVRMLSGIKGSEASRTIAAVSLYARSAEVRQAAVDELKQRDPRDFMGALIATLRRPLNYQVRPVGESGRPGVLEIERERSRSRRIYQIPPLLKLEPFTQGGYVGYDIFGKLVVMPRGQLENFLRSDLIEQFRNLVIAEKQAQDLAQGARNRTEATLARDVRSVERHNNNVRQANRPAEDVLQAVTGQWIGDDPDDWTRWWYDQQGYSYESPKRPSLKTSVHSSPATSCAHSEDESRSPASRPVLSSRSLISTWHGIARISSAGTAFSCTITACRLLCSLPSTQSRCWNWSRMTRLSQLVEFIAGIPGSGTS